MCYVLIKQILYQKRRNVSSRVPGIATKIITILFSTLHIPCNNMWYIHNIVAKQGRHCTTSGWDCLLTWSRAAFRNVAVNDAIKS